VPSDYKPLAKPPPPGSPWEPIEAARKKLEWSARQLSRAAGAKSSTHYLGLSERGWNAEVATLEKFIAALVEAGIPESDLRRRPTLSVAEAIREEAAEELIRRGFKMRQAKRAVEWAANEPERDGRRPDLTVARLVTFGAALLTAAADWNEDSVVSATVPSRAPPSSPAPRGTLYSRKRRASK
jgi:hypothetical protein